jgi:TrmH family RNA methyltransferase
MNKLSQVDAPQGILALCEKPKNAILGDKILLLDSIADPGNMGTLLRTALALGFHAVITDGCVDVTNPKVLRSTQGAFFHLNILETPIVEFIKDHREYRYFGTDLHGGIPLSQLETIPRKLGLVLGNEASGVRKEILELTDQNLFIEIAGIESLNVAVAGSILMYALKKTKEEMTP